MQFPTKIADLFEVKQQTKSTCGQAGLQMMPFIVMKFRHSINRQKLAVSFFISQSQEKICAENAENLSHCRKYIARQLARRAGQTSIPALTASSMRREATMTATRQSTSLLGKKAAPISAARSPSQEILTASLPILTRRKKQLTHSTHFSASAL